MCIKDHYPSVASFGLTKPALQNMMLRIPVNHVTQYSHFCEPPLTMRLSLAMCPALTNRTLAEIMQWRLDIGLHIGAVRQRGPCEGKSRTPVPAELPQISQHKLPRM